MSAPKNPIQMAIIGAAHGIKGELRVKTFTGDPTALGDYGPLFARDGRVFTVQSVRPQGTVVVVRFKGVADRSAAEALNGTELFIDRSALPANLDEDEFYHTDLAGLSVHGDEAGTIIGRVSSVQNFGGGDILVVKLSNGEEALIPFTAAAVPQVAISAGFLRVDPVAAGLVDDEDDPEARDADGRFEATRRPRGPAGSGGNR